MTSCKECGNPQTVPGVGLCSACIKANRIADLSLRYPELTVAQLEALDTLGERCQNCGSSFTVDPTASKLVTIHPGYHVAGTALEQREVQTTVAFCNGCEFAVELV